jgi:PAS domain S-box-containing protein
MGKPAVNETSRVEITEHRPMEEALQHREENFRSLIEGISDIVVIADRDGIVRYVSPSVERVLGHKPIEVIGCSIFEFVHPDDLPGTQGAFAHWLQNPGTAPIPTEVRGRHKDGSWRVLESIGNNRLDDPAVAGIVVNMRDVTERMRVEGAMQYRTELEGLSPLSQPTLSTFR